MSQEKKVLLILGKRGSGKSFLLKQSLKRCRRFLVYDTIGEYTDGVIFQSVPELVAFWKDHLTEEFRLIYQPLQPEVEFDNICQLVYTCGDMVFAAEEIDKFCKPNGISLAFSNIIQRGRHRDITFIGVSQRPFGINRIISSQAKDIYTFQQSEPRDLEYLSMYIGKDLTEKVRELPQYHFLHWQADGHIEIKKNKKILDTELTARAKL